MGHPVDVADLDFAEGAPFHDEDLFEELGLSVPKVVIVLAAQDLELLQHVLNVHVCDRCPPRDHLD